MAPPNGEYATIGKTGAGALPKPSPSVADILDDHVTLQVEGIDRMYLNTRIPKRQREQKAAYFFRGHRQRVLAFAIGIARIAQEKKHLWIAGISR